MDTLKRSCWHIMKTLGTGHSEKVYHTALITSLNKARIFHRSEVVCAISYLGETVGYGKADLILDDLVVEIKATSRPPAESMGQVKRYVQSLSATEKRPFCAVVVNFNQRTASVDFAMLPYAGQCIKPKNRKLVRSRFFSQGKSVLTS